MPYIGQIPSAKLLTASDITDGVISTAKLADSSVTSAKITDGTIASGDLASGVGGSNIIEMLSSPCNGTQVTVPSGTYTMPDITSGQDCTTSYADVTGSSINYTPPSGTTRVNYKFYSQISYDTANYHGTHVRFYLDGAEVTDARRTFYGNYLAGGFTFEYTINCGASGANTAHGDITSWTSAKIMKLQAREYDSGNQSQFHILKLFDGAGSSDVVVPTLTITALKDS